MRFGAFVLSVGVFFPMYTFAQTAEALLSCLKQSVLVEAVAFDDRVIEGREVKIRVTNNLPVPLGGVWVDFEIWTKERPTAIYSGSIREAATISGGLLPGETMEASDYHFMKEHEKDFARKSQELRLELAVRNAADINMLGLFDHPAMGSWADGTTDEICR